MRNLQKNKAQSIQKQMGEMGLFMVQNKIRGVRYGIENQRKIQN